MVKLTAAFSFLVGVAAAATARKPISNHTAPAPALAQAAGAAAAGTSFYYPNMDHVNGPRGYAPDLGDDYDYPVYKTVNPGDGNAIQDAIRSGTRGDRHPTWLASQPRVVYLPPGTYYVSNTIEMNTDTVIMGDATNPPIIKANGDFNGDTLFTGKDPAVGDSGELSFAVALKNVVLDTTDVDQWSGFKALDWSVAQAAHLQNVKIVMPPVGSDNNGHTGIFLTRGSTLGLADVHIEGGLNGVWHAGHQQAAYRGLYIRNSKRGFFISGGHTMSIIAPTFDNCNICVLHADSAPGISIVDAKAINNSGTLFQTNNYPSVTIDNFTRDNNADTMRNRDGTVLGPQNHVQTFTYGNTVGRNPNYGPTTTQSNRPQALAPGGQFPINSAPTYADKTVADFINVKDPKQNGGRQVYGDNSRDEAGTLNAILKLAAQNNKIAYFPFGKYRVDSTLYIPPGSRIVGEGWATISGFGDFFAHEDRPQPVVMVGREGETGIAHIQDMRFTVGDVLPGAIIVQFNMAGNAPGDVALWNSLVTVGGTLGASGISDHCWDAHNECKAAFIGIHLSKTSSVYVDNVWNWVADHFTEGGGGVAIAAKGGVLVEATKGTWLHALGSEHWWLYQLNLHNAEKVFVSLLQAETNYDQGDLVQQVPPAPWQPEDGKDPNFNWCGPNDTRCRMGFSNYINGGADIYHYASAAWVFFKGPSQGEQGHPGCGNNQCQSELLWLSSFISLLHC